MKKMQYVFLFILISYLFSFPKTAAAETLQTQIDGAADNSIIKIKGEIVNEAIVISKPITLEGSPGTIIQSCSKLPTVTIKGANVVLKQVEVKNCSKEKDAIAIYITGTNHTLDTIHLDSAQIGIKLEQASKVSIRNSFISGNGKNNGIDMWDTSDSAIKSTIINHVRDGIYAENSPSNHFIQNKIENSRYGIHIMFSDDIEVNGNIARQNITGAMLMETKGTKVWGNDFSNNNKNVNAQGLLLYDAKDTSVFQNNISNNKTGIYIEKSEQNRLFNNYVQGNYVGVQVKSAHDNTVYENNFIGNVTEAQAVNSTSNTFEKNYWDASLKLDMNGHGISSIPYRLDPYFLTLTNEVPDYQVFFRAPGMFLLERLIKSPEQAVLTDWKPLVKRTVNNKTTPLKPTALIVISTMMILGSYLLFLVGRKRI